MMDALLILVQHGVGEEKEKVALLIFFFQLTTNISIILFIDSWTILTMKITKNMIII